MTGIRLVADLGVILKGMDLEAYYQIPLMHLSKSSQQLPLQSPYCFPEDLTIHLHVDSTGTEFRSSQLLAAHWTQIEYT